MLHKMPESKGTQQGSSMTLMTFAEFRHQEGALGRNGRDGLDTLSSELLYPFGHARLSSDYRSDLEVVQYLDQWLQSGVL